MTEKAGNPNSNAHRVITFLTREELDFLDKIGKDALFSAGSKLSRSKIISGIVNAIRKLGINGCGLRSKKELESRIIKTIADNSKNRFPKLKTEIENRKEVKNAKDL